MCRMSSPNKKSIRGVAKVEQTRSKQMSLKGSHRCGSVGRVVASDNGGPQFEYSQRQNFIQNMHLLVTVGKTKIHLKRPGMAHLKK